MKPGLSRARGPAARGLRFWKLTGAGNDFVLVEAAALRRRSPSAAARRLCDRRWGVGADGLLIVRRLAGGLGLDYFNADGSRAFCGNGTRCAAWWAWTRGWAGRRMRLATKAGPVEASVSGRQQVTVSMPQPRAERPGLAVRAGGRRFVAHALDTGAPHAVVAVRGLEAFPVAEFGRALRRHPAFGLGGTNVDFVERAGKALCLRTYERGVEAETWACGTGAVAAAVVGWRLGWTEPPVRVRARGADLSVHFRGESGAVREVRLTGPARIVFQGEVKL